MKMFKEIYQITRTYPREELFGLASQTKRAAVSIPCNIAEGMGRRYKRDCLQFLHISRGSSYEVETLLNIALMTAIIDQKKYDYIEKMLVDTVRLVNGLINYLENEPGLQ